MSQQYLPPHQPNLNPSSSSYTFPPDASALSTHTTHTHLNLNNMKPLSSNIDESRRRSDGDGEGVNDDDVDNDQQDPHPEEALDFAVLLQGQQDQGGFGNGIGSSSGIGASPSPTLGLGQGQGQGQASGSGSTSGAGRSVSRKNSGSNFGGGIGGGNGNRNGNGVGEYNQQPQQHGRSGNHSAEIDLNQFTGQYHNPNQQSPFQQQQPFSAPQSHFPGGNNPPHTSQSESDIDQLPPFTASTHSTQHHHQQQQQQHQPLPQPPQFIPPSQQQQQYPVDPETYIAQLQQADQIRASQEWEGRKSLEGVRLAGMRMAMQQQQGQGGFGGFRGNLPGQIVGGGGGGGQSSGSVSGFGDGSSQSGMSSGNGQGHGAEMELLEMFRRQQELQQGQRPMGSHSHHRSGSDMGNQFGQAPGGGGGSDLGMPPISQHSHMHTHSHSNSNSQQDYQILEAASMFQQPSVHSAPIGNNFSMSQARAQVQLQANGYQQQQQQQNLGNPEAYLNYRSNSANHSPHVSPQPSPAFRTRDLGNFQPDGFQLDSAARGLFQQGQGLGHELGGGVPELGHRRTGSASSYRGSIGGGPELQELQDRFLGLGSVQTASAIAEEYAQSDFGGAQAAGSFVGQMTGGFGGQQQQQQQQAVGQQHLAGIGDNGNEFQNWVVDDGGASAMAAWRQSLRTQNQGNHAAIADLEPLVTEPADYDPSAGVDMAMYQALPDVSGMNGQGQQRRLNLSVGPGAGTSEFARRMNSESSDVTMGSVDSGEGPVQEMTDEQFQTQVMQLLRQMHGSEDQSSVRAGQGLGMPPLPSGAFMGGAVPPPKSQMSLQFGQQQLLEQARALAGHQNFPSPAFRSNGQFSSGKPHSPPALIIPDSATPSPPNQVNQIYPHQRGNDPGPSQLRHQQGAPAMPSLDTKMKAPQTNGLLGIPSGGNFGMKESLYLSPIGPGGPSINIVPSTPISGLKDGKGIWEKLALQAQNQQAQNSDNGGFKVPQLPGGGFASAAGMGPRRSSHSGHSGNYIQRAPMQLDLAGSDERLASMGGIGLPNTAPFAVPHENTHVPTALSAPPMRQRSRSEGQMQEVFSQFNIQAIRQLFGEQGQEDALSISGQSGNGMAVEIPPVVDPKMVMTASADPAHPHRNPNGGGGGRDQQGQAAAEAAMFIDWVNQQTGESGPTAHVITGVDPNGTTYILTRDGRRLSFDSRMARHLAQLNAADYLQNNATEDASMRMMDDDDRLNVGPTSSRRSISSSHRHSHSQDYGSQYDSMSDYGSEFDPTGDYLAAPQIPSAVGRSRTNSLSREASPYDRRSSSPYVKPTQAELLAADQAGVVPMPNAGRRSSVASAYSDNEGNTKPIVKAKVTSAKTENAAKIRRTSDGLFICPVPGCGSTFTRQFNLKGHVRSHNEERPYKCIHPGCNKAFARQHDCKRHMQLHGGVKPFECEHCRRQFARLDALTRHHKTDSGSDCALFHPLPTNADGTPMSEAKYRAELDRKKSLTGQ